MTWVSFALMLLKIVSQIMTWARERELVSKGQDMEIARQTSALFNKTEYAKNARERIAKMDDKSVDNALRDLEPK